MGGLTYRNVERGTTAQRVVTILFFETLDLGLWDINKHHVHIETHNCFKHI